MIYIGELRKLNLCNFFVYKLNKKETSLKMFVFFKEKGEFKLKNNIFINNKFVDHYFTNNEKLRVMNSLIMSELYKKCHFCVFVSIRGGGIVNQSKAIDLAIKRAFSDNFNIDSKSMFFSSLFSNNKSFDLRKKERKKFGLKKARKAPQYHKR